MNRIFFPVILLISILPVYSGNDKIDPLFFAYTADSLGEETDFIKIEGTKFAEETKSGSYDGIIKFDRVIARNALGEIEVLVKGDHSVASAYLSDYIGISDSISTGFLSNEGIINLSSESGIDFIEISKPMFQSADSGAYFTRISTMNSYGFTGKNVVLGFIDNGFSPDEPCFYSEGKTSVVKVWNQLMERMPGPSSFPYGEELDTALFLTHHIDDNTGHGTSILSLLSARNSVDGLVRDARVIGVSCRPSQKGVIDGIKYIEEEAVKMGRPFAVILPMNHYWGTHDGKGLLEEAINSIFKPGALKRGMSVPVGNLGNMIIHASSDINFTDTLPGIFGNPTVIAKAVKDYNLDVDIIAGGRFFVRFILRDNSGLYKSGWIETDSSKAGFCIGDSSFIGYGYNDSLKQLHVSLQQSDNALLGIQFAAKDGYSQIDCYAAQGGYFLEESDYPNLIKGDSKKTIASPAISSQALSSSAYVSRRRISETLVSPDTLFHILNWSGKASDEIIKPDFFAPGKYIFAYGKGIWGVKVDDTIGAFQGTSYAAAYTGAALVQLLQSDTFLTVSKLYAQLKFGADIVPDDRDYLPSYGFLNVYNSLKSQTVGASSIRISFFMVGDSFVGISAEGAGITLKSVYKDEGFQNIILKNDNFAIDKKPKIGKNIYVLTFKDRNGNDLYETASFYFNGSSKSVLQHFYDIAGRKINPADLRQGVLFEKTDDKTKKIVKF